MLALLLAAPASAVRLQLRVERIEHALFTAAGVEASLDWPQTAEAGELRLQIASLDAPDLGQHFRVIAWQCPLRRAAAGFVCEGAVRARGGRIPSLRIALSAAQSELSLAERDSRLQIRRETATPDQAAIVLRRVPVAWLRAWLGTLWTEGKFSDGRVDADVRLRFPDAAPLAIDATLDLDRLAFDTPDGRVAGAGVAAAVRMQASFAEDARQLRVHGQWRTGELLAGSVYVQAPAQPLDFAVSAERQGNAGWHLRDLTWIEAGVLDLRADVAFDADLQLRTINANAQSAALDALARRYLGDALARAGLGGTQLAGAAQVEIDWADGSPRAMRVRLDQVNVATVDGRFAFANLNGGLAWGWAAPPQVGHLRWQAAALYGLGFGAGEAQLESVDGDIVLRAPLRTALLGGQFELRHLRLTPRRDGQSARMRLGLALDRLDLRQLSQRLGWPPFTGSVGGVLPDAQYADNRLSFDGGLRVQVFDGEIRIEDLVLERPLGIAPTLAANVVYDNLDLQPLTAAFGFGEITGRLDGSVRNLRLLDWTPVQFDADFHSRPGYKGERRISQRAVRDLSAVGGAGLVGGLQGALLAMFDEFRYSKLGLKCRLRDNVCRMDGVGSAGQAYTIVEGSGLPNIQVLGFARKVDWPTLVARLRSVSRFEVK